MTEPPSQTSFIGAGDPSGDLLGAVLLGAAMPHLPPLRWWGYGGGGLDAQGVRLVDRLERFGTSGILEAAGRVPRNMALVGRVLELVGRRPPRLGVLVDYPDLHFVLGPALRRVGVPVVYLLPPQVWAWRPGRVRFMSTFVDSVAVAFPFEVEIYRRAGIRARFVGHPLCMLHASSGIRPRAPAPGPPVIAFLPGSRPHEVSRVLPAMVGAARRLADRFPDLVCRLAPGPAIDDALLMGLLEPRDRSLFERVDHPPPGSATTTASVALAGASAAVVHAGTVTLEAALLGVPSLVVARMSRPTWEIARRLVSVDHVALPSIVLGRRVFPERLQDEVEPRGLARDIERLIDDPHARQAAARASQELFAMLHRPDGGLLFAELARQAASM